MMPTATGLSDKERFEQKVARVEAADAAKPATPQPDDDAAKRQQDIREQRLAKAGVKVDEEGNVTATETAEEARKAGEERDKRRIERDLARNRGEEVPDEDGEIDRVDETERLHSLPPADTPEKAKTEEPVKSFDRDQVAAKAR